MKRGHLDLRSMTYLVYCVSADIPEMRRYGIRHCGWRFFVLWAEMAKLTHFRYRTGIGLSGGEGMAAANNRYRI